MEIKYRVTSEILKYMMNHTKDIEIRMLNGKSMYIKKDDIIDFYNFDNDDEFIKVKVVNKLDFNNLDDLLEYYDINRILPNGNKETLDKLLSCIFEGVYPNSKLVAIEFELI